MRNGIPDESHFDGRTAPADAPKTLSSREVFSFIADHIVAMLVGASILAILGFAIATILPKKYRAIVVMVPSEAIEGDKGGGLMSELGGLAQVAGLPVGGNSQRDEAYEVLHSRSLAWQFIEANQLGPLMFPKRWDSAHQRWKTTGKGEPSMAEQVKEFNSHVSSVSQDKLSGTIRVSITWKDRVLAAKWANSIVELANSVLRDRHIEESKRMVDYLNMQLEKTQAADVRQALYAVMERELRKSAIANVSHEYAFKIVDPAMIPDSRDWVSPNRIVFTVLGGLAGAILGAAIGHRRSVSVKRHRQVAA
jgi:uncharacterized protein involved in exopolysaccharide biosynthesis